MDSKQVIEVEAPHLIFLDLDNTLIPTAWMLHQWKLFGIQCGSTYIHDEINHWGLFDILDQFFSGLTTLPTKPCRIVIVTNAGIQTVESMYLTRCLPELKALIQKYDIALRSTQSWMEVCGPAPPLHETVLFREYYTNLKYLQFRKEFEDFEAYLQARPGFSTPEPQQPYIQVISAGDQLCEIAAALRLGISHARSIQITKQVFLSHLFQDKTSGIKPEDFTTDLKSLVGCIYDLLRTTSSTIAHDENCAHYYDNPNFSHAVNQYMLYTCRNYMGKHHTVSAGHCPSKDNGPLSSHGPALSPSIDFVEDKDLHQKDPKALRVCACEHNLHWVSKTETIAYCIGTANEYARKFCDPAPDTTIETVYDSYGKLNSRYPRESTDSDVSFHGLLRMNFQDCDVDSNISDAEKQEFHTATPNENNLGTESVMSSTAEL